MTVFNKVAEITAKQHDVEKSAIAPETHFHDDFDDSLDYVEILMKCEEEFGVRVSDRDAANYRLETVGKLAAFISDRLDSSESARDK